MSIATSFIGELKHESALTRKILSAVPFDNPDWKPHEKSMSIGRLATHIAENTHWITVVIQNDVFDLASRPSKPRVAGSKDELLEIFDNNVIEAIANLEKSADDDLARNWKLTRGEHAILETPKKIAIRGWAFSHMIHHRGQLSVYLRLLDIPVPGMYGPSADEK